MNTYSRYKKALEEIASGKENPQQIAAEVLIERRHYTRGTYRGTYKAYVPMIKEMFDKGLPPRQIVLAVREKDKYTSIRVSMVRYILRSYGYLAPPKPKVDLRPRNREIFLRHKDGEGWTKIGREIGLSPARIRQIFFRMERQEKHRARLGVSP